MGKRLDSRRLAGKTVAVQTVLALVGCGPRLEVSLQTPASPAVGTVALAGPTPRSELVMGAVDLLLRGAGITAADLEAIVMTRGPGSFTGIRVTLATAQGMARGGAIRAHGFPSLLVQAARAAAETCMAVQPARRGSVYGQPFDCRDALPQPLGEPRVIEITALDGTPQPIVAPTGLCLPSHLPLAPLHGTASEALLRLATTIRTFDAGTLVPLYLEPPQAVPPRRKVFVWPPSPTAS